MHLLQWQSQKDQNHHRCYGASVERRGTNQLHLLEWSLDVLVKHTTEIPPPTALVEVRPRLP
jgi:hypothetical protein